MGATDRKGVRPALLLPHMPTTVVFRQCLHDPPMVSVKDVVRAVASRGAASLEDLERAFAADQLPLLPALDACIDHGFLRLVLRRDPSLDLPYRVTARGKRLLEAAGSAAAAA